MGIWALSPGVNYCPSYVTDYRAALVALIVTFSSKLGELRVRVSSVKENPSPACFIDLVTVQVPIHPTSYLKSAAPLTGGTYSIKCQKS